MGFDWVTFFPTNDKLPKFMTMMPNVKGGRELDFPISKCQQCFSVNFMPSHLRQSNHSRADRRSVCKVVGFGSQSKYTIYFGWELMEVGVVIQEL